MLLTIERFYRRLNVYLGKFLALVFLLMTLNVFYDVVSRYAFHKNSVAMQELEWHLFAIIILFGVSVALMEEGHVRVDFLYDRFSVRAKAVINIIGTVFFLLPLAFLVFYTSYDFVVDSYKIKEISENPGGLPFRYVIKAMIPLAFATLMCTALGYTAKNINLYRQNAQPELLQAKIGEERP